MFYSPVHTFKYFAFITIFLIGFSFYNSQFLNLGFDFVGGIEVSVIKNDINKKAIDNTFPNLKKTILSNKIKIRLSDDQIKNFVEEKNVNNLVLSFIDKLEQHIQKSEIISIDYVGPITSQRLLWNAVWAITLAISFMLLYMSLRFDFNFGICAVISLLIVVSLCIGIIALFDMKINLNIIAALLSIIGYGINDIIVVYDRIRENMRLSALQFSYIIDNSIKQTLRRTIFTVFTTLLGNLCLILFCGDTLKDFSILVFCGILTSTYVSIILAGPLLLQIRNR